MQRFAFLAVATNRAGRDEISTARLRLLSTVCPGYRVCIVTTCDLVTPPQHLPSVNYELNLLELYCAAEGTLNLVGRIAGSGPQRLALFGSLNTTSAIVNLDAYAKMAVRTALTLYMYPLPFTVTTRVRSFCPSFRRSAEIRFLNHSVDSSKNRHKLSDVETFSALWTSILNSAA